MAPDDLPDRPSSRMDKARVAAVLEEMAALLELAEANPFEIMAYVNGARSLRDFDGELETAVAAGELQEIPGIGKGLGRVITDLVTTGRSAEYERLRQRFPPGLPDLLAVPGLGPKKIRILYQELRIDGLDSLERAVRNELVRTLPGFGARTEERLLTGIERARRYGRR